jgi:hypothetical protein
LFSAVLADASFAAVLFANCSDSSIALVILRANADGSDGAIAVFAPIY